MSRRSAGLLWLLSACSPIVQLPNFEPQPGTRALVLAVLADPKPAAYLIDLERGDGWPAFDADEHTPVIAAEYMKNRELLRLPAGKLEVAYGESGSALEPATALSQLSDAGWAAADENARAKYEELRFALDPLSCTCFRVLVGQQTECDQACARPSAPAVPTPPVLPDPPDLTPCPSGWAQVVLGEAQTVCDPPAPVACAPGSAQFLGEPGCSPLGEACSAEFSDAPAPRLYVRAGAAAGGDGTLALPFATIQDAVNVATPDTTILLGQGTYVQTPLIDRSLRIQGSCVAGTIFTPRQIMQVAGASVAFDRMTIDNPRLIVVARGAQLDASALWITRSSTTAIRVDGALIGSELWISDSNYQGIHVRPAGRLELRRARIDGRADPVGHRGIDAVAAELELHDVWMVHINASAIAARTSRLTGERIVVDTAGASGIYLYGSSTATVSDYVARHVRDRAVYLEGNAKLTLERAWMSDNFLGHIVLKNDSQATFRDLIATDSDNDGLVCEASKTLALEHAFFAENTRYNVSLRGDCGPTRIQNLISRNPRLGDGTAEGLVHLGAGELLLQRALVEDVQRYGVVLGGPTLAEDVTIRRVTITAGQNDDTVVGLEVRMPERPIDVSVERLSVSDALYYGVRVTAANGHCDGSALLRDLTIHNAGNGISIRCPIADIERASISASRFDGLELNLSDPAFNNVAPVRELHVVASGLQSNTGGIAARSGGLVVEHADVKSGGLGVWEGGEGRLQAVNTLVEGNVAGLAIYPDNDAAGLGGILFLDNMTLLFPITRD